MITTDSGLQYEVLVEGFGATPGPTDTVSAHYHGTFEDYYSIVKNTIDIV